MSSRIKLTWYDDLKAKSDLERMAVVYSIVSIPVSKIDFKESQVNGARLNDAIRHHKVEDYMQGFRNGDTFPRPVVYKTASGYVILGGNQRCEAIRRLIDAGDLPKSQEIEVYLVETTDKLLLEIIARSGNSTHGEGDTKEERVQHALYCVQRLGMAAKDAAKAFTVSATSIHHHIRAEEIRNKLQRDGIEAHRVAVASLAPIAKLKFDEPAQMKIGALVARHSPTADRVRQVVGVVEKKKTPTERIEAIKAFEKELATEAHARKAHHNGELSKVPTRPRRDKFFSLAGRLIAFLEAENSGEHFSSLDQLQITTKADVERASDIIKRLRYRLGGLSR